MIHASKPVRKLILVILIGCGGTLAVIGTSLIKTPPSKYDIRDRWTDFNCELHETQLEEQKVGISYQLMPTATDREYEEVPYKEGDFPNANYHFYVGPVSNPDPNDSASVFVCSKCIELKIKQEENVKEILAKLNSSIEEKNKILQKCINLRAFQKYYRYPRRRKRMPLVVVANDIVKPEMRLVKYRRKAHILDFQEIHEKSRTTYLEFKRFELVNRNNLELRLFVSFEYNVENAVVNLELVPKKGSWVIDHYEIKR